jgi:hypothetical protein
MSAIRIDAPAQQALPIPCVANMRGIIKVDGWESKANRGSMKGISLNPQGGEHINTIKVLGCLGG